MARSIRAAPRQAHHHIPLAAISLLGTVPLLCRLLPTITALAGWAILEEIVSAFAPRRGIWIGHGRLLRAAENFLYSCARTMHTHEQSYKSNAQKSIDYYKTSRLCG